MAVTVKVDWESGTTSADGAELVYNIHGAANDFEAWAAVRDYSPVLYLGFFRANFTVQRQGPNLYKGRVPYKPIGSAGSITPVGQTPPQPAEVPAGDGTQSGGGSPANDTDAIDGAFTFDISAKNIHIQQSFRTLFRRQIGDAPGVFGTAPDYQRAIGISIGADGRGTVAGCDVFEPDFTWTKNVMRTSVSMSYVKTLEGLVAKKNAATFYRRDAGTQLLVGVSGRQVRGGDYSLTFTFATRRNITNKIIVPDPGDSFNPNAPGALVVPSARGWDHIWVMYDTVVKPGQIVPQAKYVYVEEVIEDGDFNQLRI